MRIISGYVQSAFYMIAGINHFIHPDFYLSLIPGYFVYPSFINYLSGFLEILFGILLIVPTTRKAGSYLIMAILIAFIPSHVYFIQLGSCVEGGLCVPEWVGWTRLIIIHPLLIGWAWSVRNDHSRSAFTMYFTN